MSAARLGRDDVKLLVLNSGSSSVKYSLFEMEGERVLAEGIADRVAVDGGEKAELTHHVPGRERYVLARTLSTHETAVALIIETLTSPQVGVLASVEDIRAIGHRVVHAGTKFERSVPLTDEVVAAIEACVELSPLHNPPNLAGIRACAALLPDVPQVAVFDTAFGQTLPPEAYHYAIPYELYEQHALRRYGFHGTSHRYVSLIAAALLERRGVPRAEQKIITCHLGNGCSMTAVAADRCIETSMGLTPLEGLVMGTRSGDLDPAVVWFIMEREGLSTDDVDALLNKESGLLGVSGVGSDMRDVLAAAGAGNERARLALDLYCYRVRKYLGAYCAILGGLHAVVFTAGVGENSPYIRSGCLRNLKHLGLCLDPAANESAVGPAEPKDVAAPDSPARILVIPTNEELMIARDTLEIVSGTDD
jgi:acetate kinase